MKASGSIQDLTWWLIISEIIDFSSLLRSSRFSSIFQHIRIQSTCKLLHFSLVQRFQRFWLQISNIYPRKRFSIATEMKRIRKNFSTLKRTCAFRVNSTPYVSCFDEKCKLATVMRTKPRTETTADSRCGNFRCIIFSARLESSLTFRKLKFWFGGQLGRRVLVLVLWVSSESWEMMIDQ